MKKIILTFITLTVLGIAGQVHATVSLPGSTNVYHFSEIQDRKILDSVGNVAGTFSGAISELVPGKFGTAYNGGGKAVFDNNFGFDADQSFSVSLWISDPTLNGRGQRFIFGKIFNLDHNDTGWAIFSSGNCMYMQMNAGRYFRDNELQITNNEGSACNSTSRKPLYDGFWHHVVVTYNGTKKAAGVHMYIDGIDQPLYVDSDSLTSSIISGTQATLGATMGDTYQLEKYVDDLAVFNRILTSDEVSQIYNGGTGEEVIALSISPIVGQNATSEPVIIIPGLFGSEEKNGQLILQPRLRPYDGLRATLIANGYGEDQTLFDFPYNWRNSNIVTANLLDEKISSVKAICKCDKVNLIAHSMGGLVARQYIESSAYKKDVDKLILLGTPNLGSPKDYFAWEGGITSPTFDLFDEFFFRRLLTQEAIEAGFSRSSDFNKILFDYIHASSSPMESIRELLPIYDYLKESQNGIFRSYPSGYPLNSFLSNLNSNMSLAALEKSGVQIINILSDSEDTVSAVKVRIDTSTLPLWEHGSPQDIEFASGDGTVPFRSSLLNLANATTVHVSSSHFDLPTSASAKIFEMLTGTPPQSVVTLAPIQKILSVFSFSPIDLLLTAPDGKRIGKNFETGEEVNEIDGAYYTGYKTSNENIFIPNPLDGMYKISTEGTGSGIYRIEAEYIDQNWATSSIKTFESSAAPGVLGDIDIQLSSSRETPLTIQDNIPPVITHTAFDHEIFLNAPFVRFHFTASDSNGIKSMSAKFDGPLLMDGDVVSFQKVGAHILELMAEDFAGNIAVENIKFNVIYKFSGFLSPLGHMSEIMHKGRVVPVKFQLQDFNGNFISNATATLIVDLLKGDSVETIASFPFRYDEGDRQYIVNFPTKNLSSGDWRMIVILNDGKSYTKDFSIK